MYIAILDRNLQNRRAAAGAVMEYMVNNSLYAEILEFSRGDGLIKFADSHEIDLVLISADQLDFASLLRGKGYPGVLAVLAEDAEHCLTAFELGAAAYLIGPVDYPKISSALGRCGHIFDQASRYLTVIVDRLPVKVLLKNLMFVEVLGRTCILHCVKSALRTNIPLSRLENMLIGEPFLKCYRSYVVNMDFVSKLERGRFIMAGGTSIPISRDALKEARETYTRYVFGK